MIHHAPGLTETNSPATFQERGAALPFTMPMLAGAQVRKSKRPGFELVVLNPSGGRGFYILRPSGILGFCKPTVHDTMLFSRFSGSAEINPAVVREAALSVALEGHAGRAAMAAAQTAVSADQAQCAKTYVLLATRFMDQTDTGTVEAPPAASRTSAFDRRLEMVLHRMAPAFGCSATQLGNALTTISKAFAPVGATPEDRGARLVRLIARLEQVSDSLYEWLALAPGKDIGGLGAAVAVAMQAACKSAQSVLRTTRLMAANPSALLKRWSTGSAAILAQAMRGDWLLDGWDRVAMLWLLASNDSLRRAALLEMPLLVPELPLEVADWTDTIVPVEAMEVICRVTCLDNGWRTGGAAFPLIERNEKMRAMSI